MPVISRFLGISIMMYWKDHTPAHFHAKYNEYEIQVSLEGQVLAGEFPPKAQKLVLEWFGLHREELKNNWQKAQTGEPLQFISPLE